MFIAAALLTTVAVTTIYALSQGQKNEQAVLKIACSRDAAGMFVMYVAELCQSEVLTRSNEDISFLQIGDCCGSSAEIALSTGDFNMAVICPNAAEPLLQNGNPYVVAGGIVKNSSILLSNKGVNINTVGYTSGREIQKQAVSQSFPDVQYVPIMTTALPYALERGSVDAVVLDIKNVVLSDSFSYTPLPFDKPESILIVKKELIGTKEYKAFVAAYNNTVNEYNSNMLKEMLVDSGEAENTEEYLALWKEMKVQFLNIPSEE